MSVFHILDRLEYLLPPLDDPQRIHDITGLGTVLGQLCVIKKSTVIPLLNKTIFNKNLKLTNPKSRDTEFIAFAHALGENAWTFPEEIQRIGPYYLIYFFNQLEDSTRAKEFITEENQDFNKATLEKQIGYTIAYLKEHISDILLAKQLQSTKDKEETKPPTDIFQFLYICQSNGYDIDECLSSIPECWKEFEECRPILIQITVGFLLNGKTIVLNFLLETIIKSPHWQAFINNFSEGSPTDYIRLLLLIGQNFPKDQTLPENCLPEEAPKDSSVRQALIQQMASILTPSRYYGNESVRCFMGINDFIRRFLNWNIPLNLTSYSHFTEALEKMKLDTFYLEKLDYIFDKNVSSDYPYLTAYQEAINSIEATWKKILDNSYYYNIPDILKYLEYAEAFSKIPDLRALSVSYEFINYIQTNRQEFINILGQLKGPLKTKIHTFIANNSRASQLLTIIESLSNEDKKAKYLLKNILEMKDSLNSSKV